MNKNILHEIIKYKYIELEQLKKKYKNIIKKISPSDPSRFKENFLNRERVKIIAEIKPASPSEGKLISPGPKSIKNMARLYGQYPVGAISVLTDKKYFHGSYENITLVREVTDIPVLCKEFIIDEFQIALAKYFGAQAVLLIAESVSWKKNMELYQYAKGLGMDVLFEFHNPENLDLILKNHIDIIGFNNRSLATLEVDVQRCLQLRKAVPDNNILIAESGFDSPGQIKLLEESGFNGVLIGAAFLKSGDREKKLKELVYYYE